MRLIDVDNFKKNNPEYLQLDIDYVTEVTVEDVLDCEPTVKAIPIEWINSYTTGLIFSDDYADNADSIDYYISCIKEMVRDWEQENE